MPLKAHYQIISTLPSITSAATYLSEYTFMDHLSQGQSYVRDSVKLEFFTDKACTQLLSTWTLEDNKFTASFDTSDYDESTMSIEMTEEGLAEINTSKSIYNAEDMVNSGYSDCTVRITYQATVNADSTLICGDRGNLNVVFLLWKRTSQAYYDTLLDDTHLYTYGIELTKLFSDDNGNFDNVEFIVHNDTDNYFVKAELNAEEGVYYVVDHVENEEDATHFIPVLPTMTVQELEGPDHKVIIKGMEDDTYTATEVRTDNGYTLLQEDIEIVISHIGDVKLCDIIEDDVLGLIQNDPRYAGNAERNLSAVQAHNDHYVSSASATVDGNAVTMLEDNDSANALAPLSVVNTRGFQLPATGDNGTLIFTVSGIVLMSGALLLIFITTRKKEKKQTAQQ